MTIEDRSEERKIVLRERALALLGSDLGAAVMEKLDQRARSAMWDLGHNVRPGQEDEIARLQMELRLAETLPQFLEEVILEGQQILELRMEGGM